MAKTATKAVATTKTAIKAVTVTKTVANLNKVTNQVAFLEKYLRGTGKTLSAAQAKANYGIGNLAARMSEFRKCGLVVKTDVNTTGKTVYTVTARDVNGKRSRMFS